jgi:hypothetical protein
MDTVKIATSTAARCSFFSAKPSRSSSKMAVSASGLILQNQINFRKKTLIWAIRCFERCAMWCQGRSQLSLLKPEGMAKIPVDGGG